MPAKRTTLPPELVAEWADELTIEQALATTGPIGGVCYKAKWRHHCGFTWKTSISSRIGGNGCMKCSKIQRGIKTAEQHKSQRHSLYSDLPPEFNKTLPVLSCQFVPCEVCREPYKTSANSWKKGSRRHRWCKSGNWKIKYAVRWSKIKNELCSPIPKSISTKVKWKCLNDHMYTSLLSNRLYSASGCPHCAGTFPIYGRIQTQARAIAAHIPRFTPACDLAVLSAHGITELEGTDNLHEYLTECHKNPTTSASTIAERFAAAKSPKKEGRPGEPGSDPAVKSIQHSTKTGTRPGSDIHSPVKPPPTEVGVRAQHKRNRATLDSLPADLDTQRYQLIVDTIVSAYWAEYAALESQVRNGHPLSMTIKKFVAMQRAEATSSNNFSAQVAGEWIKQHDGAASLKLPRGFKPPFPLMMMQRLVAYHLSQRDVLGNWSAPGAGKTMAGLFAAAVLGSKLTVVICPLGVVSTWQRAVELSGYTAEGGTDALMWTPSDKASILIVNYDRLHVDSEAAEVGHCPVAKQIQAFAEAHGKKVGLLIFDECHRGKNDGETGQGGKSKNRAGLELLRNLLPAAKLLIQTGTPVLTGVREGISILKLLDDKIEDKRQLDREDSVMSAINLHMALIHYGIRFKPDYGVILRQPVVKRQRRGLYNGDSDLAGDIELAPLCNLTPRAFKKLTEYMTRKENGRRIPWNWLGIDRILTPFRIPAIVEACKVQTVVYTFATGTTESEEAQDRRPLIRDIAEAIAESGPRPSGRRWRVGVVDGIVPRKNGVLRCLRQCREHRECIIEAYKRKDLDILVCSSVLGEGVDGLQEVGSRLIINTPPWTDGAYDQLIGRWVRMGQNNQVDVVIPITYFEHNGSRYSFDVIRLARIGHRGDIADAALDGSIPLSVNSAKELRAEAERLLKKVGP